MLKVVPLPTTLLQKNEAARLFFTDNTVDGREQPGALAHFLG